MTKPTLCLVAAGALIAMAMADCGGASGGAKTDGGGAGVSGSAGAAGASATGAAGASATGTAGASATGTAGASATGTAGAAGGGGRGAGGAAGGGGAIGGGGSGNRDGGAADTSGPQDAGCGTNNPDPCICGRPDANSLSATECVQERSCRDAGGVWEPYIVFLTEGGSYGPRCETRDGSPFDAP